MKIFGKQFRVAHCRSQEREALIREKQIKQFNTVYLNRLIDQHKLIVINDKV